VSAALRPPEEHGTIIADGRHLLTGAPVRNWVSSGLQFKDVRPRKRTRQVFLHWTAGEGDAAQTFATLRQKHASVHFLVDAEARVWQFCDADMLCGHAKLHNAESVGVEITSRGDDARVKDRLVMRRDVVEMVHGRHIRYGDFSDAQKEAVLQLVETLCRAYKLPMTVPLEADGSVVSGVLPPAYLGRYHGVLGHYHTRTDKRDPAPGLLALVQRRGAERGIG
jgi:hypothetical protein